MSKVLRMIDFDDLLTYEHEQFLIEEGMRNEQESENENGWDEEQNEWDEEQNEWDDDFTADDIPF